MPIGRTAEPRVPLNRERVLRAAAALADEAGVEALTMRRLAQELGVEAMSLYNHVENKEDLLDGLVDLIVSEITLSPPGGDWKAALRQQAFSARALMQRHPWAPALVTSRRQLSAAMLRYMDSVMGAFRAGGFSPALAHHAMHLVGSRALGFVQELFDFTDLGPQAAKILHGQVTEGEYPNLTAILMQTGHDEDAEFAFSLDLILDGLERLREAI